MSNENKKKIEKFLGNESDTLVTYRQNFCNDK